MRSLTLRSGLALAVIAALVPIAALSIMQAQAVLDYNRQLIGTRLIISALAMAGRERTPLIIAKRVVTTFSHNDDVRFATSRCRAGMQAGMVDNPALSNLVRVDAQGRVLCSVLPSPPTMSFGDRQWWPRGRAAHAFTLGTPEICPISGQPVIFGMQPIYGPTGEFEGAVLAAIRLVWLKELLDQEKLSNHAVVAVVTTAGDELMTTGHGRLPRIDLAQATNSVVEAKTSGGQQWMYAAATLYEGELYLVYAEPRKVLMATALEQVRFSLILPVVAILLTLIGIIVSANRLVVRWLARLSTMAGQFSQGNYRNDLGEFASAPREIQRLSADMHAMAEAIATRDQHLRDALDAKTALTSEVHHRVKNNLQIVSSLLTLQAGRVADPIVREVLNQTRARIGALTQIHHLLHEDAFGSDSIDASHLMTDLCAQLRSLHAHQENVELLCQTASCVMPVSNAVPLSLFAVEAVTNSFRHAFPDNRRGLVTVALNCCGTEGMLSISDNGVGLNGKTECRAVGTLLMAGFVQQLNGTYKVERARTGGTQVMLRFPLNGQAATRHSMPRTPGDVRGNSEGETLAAADAITID
ncbi:MAG: histidine kinase dimerization/phosphoacceptor domain -containing protein [Novosphingobium sp.]